MIELATNTAFQVYVAATLLLLANVLFLWVWSGVVRAGTKTVRNPEDSAVAKGASVVDADPPEVARVLRAHRNAVDNIVPFLVAGLLFVLVGGGPTAALALFGAFVAFRFVHSWAYLSGKQPFRTVSFVAGLVTTLVLIGWVSVLVARVA